ncbi:pentatricopeptide repeat-containing protein At2g03380, mitochondrial-like [Quercus robur]|uniref:pentatricopeptide repeat-containing protein At2g03380, mitochondrial-like n=1 Tax=Quercus robur TaxID=38942 RepID=UPI0021628892|nr:pentatricopeptide repeat-containing protein At2g03380, mitochondrial-like [Quercus robur]
MAILTPLGSLNGHCTEQSYTLRPFKVTHYSLSHALYSKRASSLCYSTKFQNCSTSIQFQENPSQKSIVKTHLLHNQPSNSVSSASKLIKECVDDGLFENAIRVYLKMFECDGFQAEKFRFFPCLIKAFGGLGDVDKVKQVHGHVLNLGVLNDVSVGNSLLSVYLKCGAVEDAVQMFEEMGERDPVSWNSMISGFYQSGDYMGALITFSMMIWEYGVYPNRVACLSALSSCSSIKSLIRGREIHGFVVKSGLNVEEFLVSGLIEMYMKCGDVRTAEHVFKGILDNESSRGNAVIWNVMILGYVSNGCLLQALDLFLDMLAMGTKPDSSTLVAVLVLCSQLSDLAVGKQMHGCIVSFGLDYNVRVETALIDMYFKCGDPETGLKIFRSSQNRNLVMWGAVISNCAQGGCAAEALELFYTFLSKYGFADSVMLLAVLRACSFLTLNSRGMEIHGLAIKTGFDDDMFIGGALVDMYAKCQDIESAQKVFQRLPARDLVLWNSLISGYAQNECADKALKAFCEMQSEQIAPNSVTASCILSVCARFSVMILCKEIHCYLLRRGIESNVSVSNSLIATYAKCGDIDSSTTLFEKMLERDKVSWNSIILGFGMHGHTDEMFVLFKKMTETGMKPDHATFTALLSACSHTGRVDMGLKCFKSMVEDHKLEPRVEQYTCIVDLLGRAGHLKQAYDLIMTMPCVPDDLIWGSLLGSCKTHGNEKLAELVSKHIFELDPTCISYRVLLSNIYEGFGKQNEVTRVRSEIKDLRLKKQPGCSWIEVDHKIHSFISGDHSHHQSKEIYGAIESLTTEMKRVGYNPRTQNVIGSDESNVEGINSSKDIDLLYNKSVC